MSPSNSSAPKINENSTILELLHALKSQDIQIRRTTIRSLGQLGPEATKALPALRETLKDSDFSIRLEAAIAIGFIGTKKDTPHLLPLLDDKVEAVRFQTISALAFLKDAQAIPELLARYDNETHYVQDQILRALGHLGGEAAYSLLKRELQADNPIIRTGAVVGFSFLQDPRSCPLLEQVAKEDPDEIVAHEARLALYQIQASCSRNYSIEHK